MEIAQGKTAINHNSLKEATSTVAHTGNNDGDKTDTSKDEGSDDEDDDSFEEYKRNFIDDALSNEIWHSKLLSPDEAEADVEAFNSAGNGEWDLKTLGSYLRENIYLIALHDFGDV